MSCVHFAGESGQPAPLRRSEQPLYFLLTPCRLLLPPALLPASVFILPVKRKPKRTLGNDLDATGIPMNPTTVGFLQCYSSSGPPDHRRSPCWPRALLAASCRVTSNSFFSSTLMRLRGKTNEKRREDILSMRRISEECSRGAERSSGIFKVPTDVSTLPPAPPVCWPLAHPPPQGYPPMHHSACSALETTGTATRSGITRSVLTNDAFRKLPAIRMDRNNKRVANGRRAYASVKFTHFILVHRMK